MPFTLFPEKLSFTKPMIVPNDIPAAEFIEVMPSASAPKHLRNAIMIDTVHEGKNIPELYENVLDIISQKRYEHNMSSFVKENDWGADQVGYLLSQ